MRAFAFISCAVIVTAIATSSTTPTSAAQQATKRHAVKGEHFKEGTIISQKAGKGQKEFLKVKMDEVIISSRRTPPTKPPTTTPTTRPSQLKQR